MRLPLRPLCWVPAKAQKNKAVSDEQSVLQRVLVRAILTCERTYYPMFERGPLVKHALPIRTIPATSDSRLPL